MAYGAIWALRHTIQCLGSTARESSQRNARGGEEGQCPQQQQLDTMLPYHDLPAAGWATASSFPPWAWSWPWVFSPGSLDSSCSQPWGWGTRPRSGERLCCLPSHHWRNVGGVGGAQLTVWIGLHVDRKPKPDYQKLLKNLIAPTPEGHGQRKQQHGTGDAGQRPEAQSRWLGQTHSDEPYTF